MAGIAAILASLGAGASLVGGITLGVFSSRGHASGSNAFSAGVVSLGSPVSTTCAINPMSPGDASTGWSPAGGNASCTYQVTYSGNIPAILGLDVSTTGGAGAPVAPNGGTTPSPAAGLFDGTANGLQVLIADVSLTTFLNHTTYQNQAGSPVALSATSSVTGLLVSRTAFGNGDRDTITVDYKLPAAASNAYNSATTTIVLVIHAVQANHNPLPAGCAAGNACSAGFSWS